MTILVTAERDTATPLFDALGAGFPRLQLHEAMAESAATLVQDHLRARNSTHPNRLGGARTNFWNQASEATTASADATAGYVNVAGPDGIRYQLEGGSIRPVTAPYLTIPAQAIAHGRRVSDFPSDAIFSTFLKQPRGQTIGYIFPREGGAPLFILSLGTRPKAPDPSVLPTDEQLATAARGGAEVLMEELTR